MDDSRACDMPVPLVPHSWSQWFEPLTFSTAASFKFQTQPETEEKWRRADEDKIHPLYHLSNEARKWNILEHGSLQTMIYNGIMEIYFPLPCIKGGTIARFAFARKKGW